MDRRATEGCVQIARRRRIVRLGERTGVANGETHLTRCGARLRLGDAHHLRRDVDPDDLAVVTEIVSEGERCLAETTAHVEQPLTAAETQLVALPCAQAARRLPLRGGVHRREEHRYVRIAVDQFVAEAVRVIDGHTRTLRLLTWPQHPPCAISSPTCSQEGCERAGIADEIMEAKTLTCCTCASKALPVPAGRRKGVADRPPFEPAVR